MNDQFREALKQIVILASPPELQVKAMGIGDPEDEIAIDFEFYCTNHLETFVALGYLDKTVAAELASLDRFFAQKSTQNDDRF